MNILRVNKPSSGALNDPDRLAALAATGLDTVPEESFDRLTRMVTRLLGVPVSLVSLVDDKRQFFKSAVGLTGWPAEDRSTPLSHSFCQTVVIEQTPLIVTDAKNDARVCDNLAVSELGVQSYLGVPLIVSGHVIGSLCAIDDTPRQWSESDLNTMSDVAAIVMSEIGLREEITRRRAAEDNQVLLIAELDHRVKNTLATVQALIQMSLSASPSLTEFRDTIGVRIASLAKTHTLLTQKRWQAIAFRDILMSELAPFDQQGRIVLNGPDFDIEAEVATTLGMVVHELTTNAAKYGALSLQGGKIAVDWSIKPNAAGTATDLSLAWRESGGPAVKHEGRKGFGSTLIERLIVKQFGGAATFDFAPSGLVFAAALSIPIAA